MKYLPVLFILFTISASSQKLNIDTSLYKNPYKFKHQPMKPTPLALTHLALVSNGVAAGISQGRNDVIDNNRHAFAHRHPDLNPAWWDKTITAPRLNSDSWLRQNFFSFTQDLWHQQQTVANICIANQIGLVAILSMDDFNRHKKIKWGKMILYVVEANASRLIAKRATLEYYNVF